MKKILNYIILFFLILLFFAAASCAKEDDRCITYKVEQYQKDDILCSDGICEVTYITEIFCSYYETNR
jgi:hypothetical protein